MTGVENAESFYYLKSAKKPVGRCKRRSTDVGPLL